MSSILERLNERIKEISEDNITIIKNADSFPSGSIGQDTALKQLNINAEKLKELIYIKNGIKI